MLRLTGLRASRERRLYSEGELGRLVGMRASEIAAIERGDRLVRPATAVRFSQALGVGLHDLTESPEERHDRAYNMNRPNQPVVSCFDPRGRNVVATLGWWENHIEDEHPEVGDHFDAVALTIENPDVIMRDAEHADGENYYRMGALPGYPDKYLKVCVSYRPVNAFGNLIGGWVVTAYPTRRVKRGETRLWSR